MDKKLQNLAAQSEPLTDVNMVRLRREFADVFLWRMNSADQIETLAGTRYPPARWEHFTVITPAEWWPIRKGKKGATYPDVPANKPLDLLSEELLMQDVAAGNTTAIEMVAELLRWYTQLERDRSKGLVAAGKKRGEKISEKAAKLGEEIAALPHRLSSGQVEKRLATKGTSITDRTVRRHRKKPGK